MKLSCIVPTLNEEDNVKGFLEGYSIQTEKFHELIFVDGNSKDKTIEVIKQYQKKFPEIKIIICDRKGPAAARNEGLDNATGEFVIFMDADWRFFGKDVLKKINYNLKNEDLYIFHIQYSNDNVTYTGLRKYICLKDETTFFHIIKKEKTPKWNEELGFGEDRIWFKDAEKNTTCNLYFKDSEIKISGRDGVINIQKVLRRNMWYGRTLPFYLLKTKDIKQTIRYFVFIISIFPLLWFIPFLKGFIRGLKNIKYGIDIPFGLGFIELVSALGTSIGFFQYLFGTKHIGRDKV